jgi:two-component system sensor histidine kinase KdpD
MGDNVSGQITEVLLNQGLENKKGVLKIFLGYAHGVGKSYAMLEEARQQQLNGINVVVGTFDYSHHYPQTDELVKTFPSFLEVKDGKVTQDINNLDEILLTKPQLVLIDELAFSNPSNARHPKRYQDVEELLAAGINVFATLNIQNLEDLNEIIYQITGVRIQETIPKKFMDKVDEIEVVDLSPELLSHRIILPIEKNNLEFNSFYRKGDLSALRELALRYAADHVDFQMLDYMGEKSIKGPWPTRERILVAIGANPLGAQLVRRTQRLANMLNAEWVALYVETPQHLLFPLSVTDQVSSTLKLAEDLGAKTVTLSEPDVSSAILNYAQKHNITKIVLGKSPRNKWYKFYKRSILENIIRNSGTIDINVVSGKEEKINRKKISNFIQSKNYREYFFSIVILTITTIISDFFHPWLDPTNLVMPYLTVVVVCAYFFGRGPAMMASFLGVLAFDFFFIEPRFTLNVNDTQYLLTFFGLLVVGLVISSLTARVRDQVAAIQKKQIQTNTLFSLSQGLTIALGLDEILLTVIDHIRQTIAEEVVIYFEHDESVEIKAKTENYQPNDEDLKIAKLTLKLNQPTGVGTDTYPSSNYRFQPLRTQKEILGILGVKLIDVNIRQKSEQHQLLEAYAGLAAMAIERYFLEEKVKETQVIRESEKLKTTLLNSVSHDFRTPLVSIIGVLDSLFEVEKNDGETMFLDQTGKLDLIQTAQEEAHRLNLLVQNLLDMTRLESGSIKLKYKQTDLQDLISTALSRSQLKLKTRKISLSIPNDLPGIDLDFILMEQVLVNILDNINKYSDLYSPIDIDVIRENNWVEIRLADRGVGIPTDSLNSVFEKFYRIDQARKISGTGLGLSICKGIVEAHQGKISAENRAGGGTIIKIGLPIHQQKMWVTDEK